MKLSLGTVQWGMNYGISNENGVPSDDELNGIFSRMKTVGIDTLDTAASYGNSEKRIGNLISPEHKVISKFNFQTSKKSIKEQCCETLENLKLKTLEGYLFHNSSTLTENEFLWEEFIELKRIGYVKKIGYSVYNTTDLERLLEMNLIPDIVQLPLNILDRRFQKYFERLKNIGVEIHVRSVFLQGLLISAYHQNPKNFEQWQPLWQKYRIWLESNSMSSVEACIRHVLSFKAIDKIIVGVTTIKELNEVIDAGSASPLVAPSFLESNDNNLINPLEWLVTKQLLSKG